MRRWWLVLGLVACGCEPELCWSEGDPEARPCEEYEVDRGCEGFPEDFEGEDVDRASLEDAWLQSHADDDGPGIEGPLPDDVPGNPAPSAAELRVTELEPPAWVGYALADLDVSELGFCRPRPGCVESMLRATSGDRSILVFDGTSLSGSVLADRRVVIADVPRRLLLELPANAEVRTGRSTVQFCATGCQTIDLVRGEVALSPGSVDSRVDAREGGAIGELPDRVSASPSATSPAPGERSASSST